MTQNNFCKVSLDFERHLYNLNVTEVLRMSQSWIIHSISFHICRLMQQQKEKCDITYIVNSLRT